MIDNDVEVPLDHDEEYGEMSMSFCIRGDALQPAAVTGLVGMKPSDSFAKGDPFVSGGKVVPRATGVWRLNSRSHVRSDFATPHARFLLGLLEPQIDGLMRYVLDPGYEVLIYADWRANIASGFDLPADMLSRLCALCNTFAATFWPSSAAPE